MVEKQSLEEKCQEPRGEVSVRGERGMRKRKEEGGKGREAGGAATESARQKMPLKCRHQVRSQYSS